MVFFSPQCVVWIGNATVMERGRGERGRGERGRGERGKGKGTCRGDLELLVDAVQHAS